MPKYAGKYRAMQFAVLREYTYEVLTSDKFGEMLEIAEEGEFYWWKRAHERYQVKARMYEWRRKRRVTLNL
jgi:Zn-dependent M32 family carboxypeptidase